MQKAGSSGGKVSRGRSDLAGRLVSSPACRITTPFLKGILLRDGILCILGISGILAGCSAGWYRRSADGEVYEILKRERKAVSGEEGPFKVEQSPLSLEAVGRISETEDLKRSPAPQPIITPLAGSLGAGVSPAGSGEEPKAKKPEGPAAQSPSPAPVSPEPAPASPGPAPASPGPAETSPAPAPPSPGPATSPPAPSPGAQGTQEAPRNPGGPSGGPPGGPSGGALPAQTPSEKAAAERIPKVSTRLLTLKESLTLAFANNREYQSQRETVYTSALALTLAYHEFAPRFLGVITGDWANSGGSESGRIGTDFGLNLLLVSGARLSLHLLNNFSQFFTGDRRQVAATLVNGTLTQPLLRGFGSEIVREPVTQAERDVTYEVRAFERFRKTFAVSVITEYYRVLQERDRVTNEYNNWQSLVSNRDRVEALALAQRVPRFQVDQARQQEFQAQDTWVAAVERYERALDGFKLTLGISTDSNISLDQGELEKLGREAIESLGVTVEVAIEWALKMRLDLKTAWDQVKDTERASRVAADGLRAQLDINANTALTSGSGSAQKPLAFHGQNLTYGFGFDLDLPLDRKRERNAYVQALIANERAKRDLSQAEDNIRLTVRDSYRRLEREIVSYKIQKDSLALAEQRVDSTSALLQAGRAATRDVLESQSALITARNALTGSFINHFIAKIDFLSETEALHVDDQGQIQELPIGVMPND